MNRASRISSIVVLAVVAVAGAWLRLHDLARQIPLDDEWHALDFALSRDAWFLFRHFSRAGANSVPYNLYLRGLLRAAGWNEVTISLPSLVAGVGLLWLFPRWVWQRFGGVAGAVTAVWLALAPFLIFYSRLARAYSAVLFFEALGLIALCQWLRSGRRRDVAGFAAFSAVAIWFHASALAPLAAAVFAAAAMRWLAERRGQASGMVPPVRAIVTAGLGMLAMAGMLWLPALMSPMPEVFHPASDASPATLARSWQLLCGTASPALQIVCAVVVVAGLALGAPEHQQEMLVFGASFVSAILSVVVSRQNSIDVAGVFVRYAIVCFLTIGLAVGLAVSAALHRATRLVTKMATVGAVVVLFVGLVLAGPLPAVCGSLNSFTRHPTFGFDFARYDSDRPRPDPLDPTTVQPFHRRDLPPFYGTLGQAPGSKPIVEYPFVVGQDTNLFYFAQQTHGRRVLGGYVHSGAGDADIFGLNAPNTVPAQRPPSSGFVTNALMVDHVLGRVPENPGFRTVVDLADPGALARSGAEYVVLHWNLLHELFHIGPASVKSAFVARARARLAETCGAPVFDSETVTVFRLPGTASGS